MYGTITTITTGARSSGCRSCGWSYCGGTGCYGFGNVVVFDVVRDRWIDPAEERLRDMLAGLKLLASISIPDWLIELCALPRRMKRPFPPDLPGPALCYAVARPQHRRYRRIKRIWRNAA